MTRPASWPNYAGLRYWAKARSTGTQVSIYRADQAGLDDDNGKMPYSTVCETHGTVICHESLKMARSHVAQPEHWCDAEGGCIEQYRNKKESQ
jgi:hypothetical protein